MICYLKLPNGCTCGRSCLSQFSQEQIRESCTELGRDELDLVILGQLHSSTNTSSSCGPSHKHKATKRQRRSVAYRHKGKAVCPTIFDSYKVLVRSTFTNTNAVLGVGACTCVCNIQLYLVGMRLGLLRK